MVITDLEITQASIEVVGGIVSAMLAVIMLINYHGTTSLKLIIRMLFMSCALFFLDAFAYVFRGNTDPFSLFMTRFSNFGVFFMNMLMAYVFVKYIYSILREKDAAPGDIYQKIASGCFWVAVGILVLNLFNGWMYTFDEANYYHRSWGWYVYTGISLVCLASSCIMVWRFRGALDRFTWSSLLLFELFPIVAILVQAAFYGISIINVGIGLCIVLVLVAYLVNWSRGAATGEYDDAQTRRSYDTLVLFIIMLICVSSAIVSCIFSIKRADREISVSNSQIVAHIVSDRLDNVFLRPITVTEIMARDDSLQEYMEQSNAQDHESGEAGMAAYLESIRSGFDYQMVYAVCAESRFFYTYNGFVKTVNPSVDPTDAWYADYLASGQSYEVQVDTDAANDWDWSFFVNHGVLDKDGRLLGVCGVGLELAKVQQLLADFEDQYTLRITLADADGDAIVTARDVRVGKDLLDAELAKHTDTENFSIQEQEDSIRMTKLMEDMNWYLVIEDMVPQRVSMARTAVPSVIVSLVGLFILVAVFCIITLRERRISMELLEKQRTSLTDELTGLGNRRALRQDCQRLEETGKLGELTVVGMDLNELKRYNDSLGHQVGDELICGTAQCMLQSMQGSGTLYRAGGDEFVAILHCTKEELEEILREFDRLAANWQGDHIRSISVARGVVRCEEFPQMGIEEILNMADRRMYENKREYYLKLEKAARQ